MARDRDDFDDDIEPDRRSRREPGRHVPNYLVQSILATLFCCLPLGVVAIVYSVQVNSHVDAGNYSAAQKASDNAKKFVNLSVIIGLVGAVAYILLVVMGGMMAGGRP